MTYSVRLYHDDPTNNSVQSGLDQAGVSALLASLASDVCYIEIVRE